jgi:hypothetical protein
MITPAYAPTATERVLPRLALDFTTAVTDSRVATARAGNTATRFNSSGLIETVNANLARYDFNPSTLICNGQLIEEARTNLFLNSLIDGTNLATQSVTVTAVAHTISFYGTGTITLSGAATATVVGTGAYPNRQTLTFTPIAGVLVCTVTGSVQYAQIEIGSFATSFIPTAATSVARNADAVSMTGTNFSDWYNASQGAFFVQATPTSNTSAIRVLIDVAADANNRMTLQQFTSGIFANLFVFVGGAVQVNAYSLVTAGDISSAIGYKINDFAIDTSVGIIQTDSSGTVVTPTFMRIGARQDGGIAANGHIQQISYWPQRLTNNEIQAFAKG